MGYVPNNAAQRLIRARSNQANTHFDQVGFLLLRKGGIALRENYLISLMQGIEMGLAESNASMVFLHVADESHWERASRIAGSGIIDGWLLAGEMTEQAIRRVTEWGRPFLVLGAHDATDPLPHVDLNYKEAARMAVQHLANLGHRRIALAGTTLNYQYQRDLRDGFRSAVKELGLDDDEPLSHVQNLEIPELLSGLLSLKPAPTALVLIEPGLAQLVMSHIERIKFHVPDEMSLVACELDLNFSPVPTITQIVFPYQEVGRVAAGLLREIVVKPGTRERDIRVMPTFKHGLTCGRPLEACNER